MFVWNFFLVHDLRPDDIELAQWHKYVRVGLVEAGKWLIEHNLRKEKWSRSAPEKYHFNPRERRYINKKLFAKRVRDPETGIWVKPRRPTQDLVYIGYLIDFIKGRSPEDYNIEARSVQNRIRVRIPIPTPHRMQKAQYSELSEWTLREYVAMRHILFESVARQAGITGSVANLERRARYANVA